MTPTSVDARTNGSTSSSSSRVMALAASLVCSVASTMWPVSAACRAISAVSASRTSPTMMTSGSCRSTWRSASANPNADLGLHGDLVERLDDDLDRVLDGDDVDLGGRDACAARA